MRGDQYNGHHHVSADSARSTRQRIVLWHLRGSLDDLACVVSPTSYGYTLGLELAGEAILLELQPNVERLTDKAARIEQWLLTQGWEPTSDDQ